MINSSDEGYSVTGLKNRNYFDYLRISVCRNLKIFAKNAKKCLPSNTHQHCICRQREFKPLKNLYALLSFHVLKKQHREKAEVDVNRKWMGSAEELKDPNRI